MGNPQRLPDDDPPIARDDDAAELQRRAEEAMEQMLLAQENEGMDGDVDGDGGGDGNGDGVNFDHAMDGDLLMGGEDGIDGDQQQDLGNEDDEHVRDEHDMAFLNDELMNGDANFRNGVQKKNPFTYVRVSFWAALALVYYSYRSRQQWYLALVFLCSSKYAYVILGNAFIALLIWLFTVTTNFFLNGLRLNEAEGLTDFFRWHITETCLALTIFRSELNVQTFVLFLFLVLAKCLHYIVDTRESHMRMTEEIVVVNPSTGWIALRLPHIKLFALICILQILDIFSVIMCGQDIMKNGPTVSILFAFESAIMLTSVISNSLLWYLHLLDGIFHFMHDSSEPGTRFYKWIYTWKDHKATLVFAVELQAQAANFLFYLTFFAIVMTYHGLPINLIREVYVSFLALKQRVVAFNVYRQLMSSMNRFKTPTQEELEDERICIICRDEMTVETAKRLPGCGHIFHKSCLREWLVRQQTCPTCRGDISAMEAREKAQDQMNARIQEQQQVQEQEDDNEIEGETSVEDQQPLAGDTSEGKQPTDTSNGEVQPPSLKVENDSDEIPPATSLTVPLGKGKQKTKTAPTTETKSSSTDNEQNAFPAFYRVAQDIGAPVYSDHNVGLSDIVVRVVPCGLVFLGIEMNYRKCNGENRMMIRMPDGWVGENGIERIVAVPLEFSSLPTQ